MSDNAMLDSTDMVDARDIELGHARQYIRQLEQRIQKAREILESGREESSSASLWESIVAALDALEGK